MTRLHCHRNLVTRSFLTCTPTHAALSSSYSLAQLLIGELNENLSASRKEAYLADDEFATFFEMNKLTFWKQPLWKQQAQKKEHLLF